MPAASRKCCRGVVGRRRRRTTNYQFGTQPHSTLLLVYTLTSTRPLNCSLDSSPRSRESTIFRRSLSLANDTIPTAACLVILVPESFDCLSSRQSFGTLNLQHALVRVMSYRRLCPHQISLTLSPKVSPRRTLVSSLFARVGFSLTFAHGCTVCSEAPHPFIAPGLLFSNFSQRPHVHHMEANTSCLSLCWLPLFWVVGKS
jgi:hypothetical protein